MSAPPLNPNDTPDLSPSPRKRSTLAKLAILFAAVLVVTFGLCSITLANSYGSMNGLVFPVSIVIVGICASGLLVCGVLAIINALRRRPN